MKTQIVKQIQTNLALLTHTPKETLHRQQALRRLKRVTLRWLKISFFLAAIIPLRTGKLLWGAFFGAELVRQVGPGITPLRRHEWENRSSVDHYR